MVRTYGLAHVALAVRDVRRSLAFYRQALGMVAVYEHDSFVQAQTPGTHDVLVLEQDAERAGRAGGIIHFGFRLADPAAVDATANAVEAAGGTITNRGEFCPGEPYVCTIASAGAMVQPFVPEVSNPGEWSLVFFGGWFSHAVLKRPGTDEFRVQLEHGGSAELTIAPRRLVQAAERVLAQVDEPWLYARVDGCEVGGRFLLMELEMLEPSLFLELHPVAPLRFAASIRALIGAGREALTR
jgi:catechol 2,3-dioxygenase-like lactoylglutathione lyase family enzyme